MKRDRKKFQFRGKTIVDKIYQFDANGASWGILTIWDSRVIPLLDKEDGLFTLSCRFKFVEDRLDVDFYKCLWS